MTASRRLLVTTTVALAVLGLSPTAAQALPYDGTNPANTVCGDGSHPRVTLNTQNITVGAQIVGRVELRQSVYCATVWTRVYNLTSNTLSAREHIYLYDSPNDTTPTIHTETDQISAGGSATSLQYRDRPSFQAFGELSFNGAWREAHTTRSLMYSQNASSYPLLPNSCDNTSGTYCIRWPTPSGNPYTIKYRFEPSLQDFTTPPNSAITAVLEDYEDLSGPSPNFTLVTGSDYEVNYFKYNDDDGARARTSTSSYSSSPRHIFAGYTKFNYLYGANTSNWNPTVCHETGHLLGFAHITYHQYDLEGSQATCMGGDFQGPHIDDQFLLDKIYSIALP
jgi:hypothetical protein